MTRNDASPVNLQYLAQVFAKGDGAIDSFQHYATLTTSQVDYYCSSPEIITHQVAYIIWNQGIMSVCNDGGNGLWTSCIVG
jgi:hypothetical protein